MTPLFLQTFLLTILFDFVSSKITVNKIKKVNYLDKCVEDIANAYFKSSDLVKVGIHDPRFNRYAFKYLYMVRRENYMFPEINRDKTKSIVPDAYILIGRERYLAHFLGHVINYEWNPRARFLFILTGSFEPLIRMMRNLNMLNVAVMLAKPKQIINIYTYFPYNNSIPYTQPVLVDKCIRGRLQNISNLYPAKVPEKLDGVELRVTLMQFRPYIYQVKGGFRGIFMDILNLIQKKLNVTIEQRTLRQTFSTCSKANCLKDSVSVNPTNVKTDIIIGIEIAAEQGMFQKSFPLMEDTYNWAVPAASLQLKPKKYEQIFDVHIWYSLFICLTVTSASLYIMATRTGDIHVYQNIRECFRMCFQYLIGQSLTRLPQTSCVRILFVTWALFTLIIITAFQSKLIANSYDDSDQVTTVEEMIQSNLQLRFNALKKHYFEDESNKIDRYIYQNFKHCSPLQDCLALLVRNKSIATIGPRRTMLDLISKLFLGKKNESLVNILKEDIISFPITMLYVKGMPFAVQIDKLLIQLRSTGFIEYYSRKLDNNGEKALELAKSTELGVHVLTLYELQNAFWLLLLGLAMSTIVLICEIIYSKKSRPSLIRKS